MMNLRLIIPFCFFLLLVCPSIAAAECQPRGTAVEIISKVNTHTYEWIYKPLGGINTFCANLIEAKDAATKEFITGIAISEINELPQCQPEGQLARECVGHEAVSANYLPPGKSTIHNYGVLVTGNCEVIFEYTVCTYMPTLGKASEPQLPKARQRGPRSRRGR